MLPWRVRLLVPVSSFGLEEDSLRLLSVPKYYSWPDCTKKIFKAHSCVDFQYFIKVSFGFCVNKTGIHQNTFEVVCMIIVH
ncbi:hypothetical protein CEXT_285951 [Caerostris extrusa]|uniref:Secreted protein n=1 Tax=Caerostris extrusa TaxID=172846 RepID=A0AAV4SNM5_CAEEX|nr:hypothetical protein CEXT_285951 [Caerostris extrusa]